MTEKQLHIATMGVMVVVGFLSGYLFREIAPVVNQVLPRACEYRGKTYEEGATVPSGDRCNSCSCQDGQVNCTAMYCADQPVAPEETSGVSTGVAVPVQPGQSAMEKIPDLPLTVVPQKNLSVQDVVEHRSALNGHMVTVTGVVIANYITQENCVGRQCPQMDMNMQPSIILADSLSSSRNMLYDLRVLVAEGAPIPPDTYQVGKTASIKGTVLGGLEGVTLSF